MTNAASLFAVADWHADKAIKAYHDGEFDTFCRHISIADGLRHRAYSLKRAA